MANWAKVPVLAHYEVSTTLIVTEDAAIIDAVHTVTTYTGFVYDDDDGLPLSYPGERSYNDGRAM